MSLTFSVLAAIILDYCLGEPRNSYHPLVFFGRWTSNLEKVFLKSKHAPLRQKCAGALAVMIALLPCFFTLALFGLPPKLQDLLGVIILYFCIGARSLRQHAMAVYEALQQDDLSLARERVGYIVSRQTEDMSEIQIRRATIESVLENGADAVFAPLFWFAILGPFGALLYRFSNTLDAMWGYKNERYIHFGWAAARLDDSLNWLPARLTALSYTALGNTRLAFIAWRRDSGLLESPNAGPVMTAGAGALDLRLGGPAIYHGRLKNKPWFGGEHTPNDSDIVRATRLIYKTLSLWILWLAVIENFI